MCICMSVMENKNSYIRKNDIVNSRKREKNNIDNVCWLEEFRKIWFDV